MSKRKNIDNLTEAEIHSLLFAKLRSSSQKRLEHFHRTGRRIELVSVNHPSVLEALATSQVHDVDPYAIDRSFGTSKPSINKLLLFVEVLAIAVLLYFVSKGVGLHHLLNRSVSAALNLPALTPTPLISAIVLPSGHVHERSPSGQSGRTEIPKHLLPLVQSPVSIPTPTSAPQHGIRIQIPAINVDAPIVHGDDSEQLKKGVAHHDGSANPGQDGNFVLSGHNDIYGEVFRYLEDLKPGDKIIVYTSQRAYIYVVSGWELVEPSQVSVMASTPNATITLISCHPYLIDNHRIVVKGGLVE